MNNSKKQLILITASVIILAFLFSAFAWWQIYNYEQGVAELYAQEQDGYVEIVARQITLYGDIAGVLVLYRGCIIIGGWRKEVKACEELSIYIGYIQSCVIHIDNTWIQL